jgi:hypothetical protein
MVVDAAVVDAAVVSVSLLCSGYLWQKWAQPCKWSQVGAEWHSPSSDELAAARSLLETVLQPRLAALVGHDYAAASAGPADALVRAADVVLAMVRGVSFALVDTTDGQGASSSPPLVC